MTSPPEKVREPAYASAYQMSVAEWMIHHQEKIVFSKVRWMGTPILKNPLDCWIYQEIIWLIQPEILIEIGSYAGGSTMYFSHLFDLLRKGQVISIDIDRSSYVAKHPRIIEITGDCSDQTIVDRVAELSQGKRVMVVHDADHRKQAVLRDLRLYASMVSIGSYFIVEDGVVDVFAGGVSSLGWTEPGPLVAIREFLEEDTRFVPDLECERYLITYNPRGFLKRVR